MSTTLHSKKYTRALLIKEERKTDSGGGVAINIVCSRAVCPAGASWRVHTGQPWCARGLTVVTARCGLQLTSLWFWEMEKTSACCALLGVTKKCLNYVGAGDLIRCWRITVCNKLDNLESPIKILNVEIILSSNYISKNVFYGCSHMSQNVC